MECDLCCYHLVLYWVDKALIFPFHQKPPEKPQDSREGGGSRASKVEGEELEIGKMWTLLTNDNKNRVLYNYFYRMYNQRTVMVIIFGQQKAKKNPKTPL